jgi:hypothetical protein
VTFPRGQAACRVMLSSTLLVCIACGGGTGLARAPLPPSAPSPAPATASSPAPPTASVARRPGQLGSGSYETLAKVDWSSYPDKAALAGQFGIEGHLNACKTPDRAGGTRCDPHLPAEDFYDLVADPVFGKVIRYNGGPQLNTNARNMPGRTAVHGVDLGGERTHVWVRQFVRFSPNWTTRSETGGQGAPDYKAMFLRYANSPARHQVKFGTTMRGLVHEGGNAGVTKVSEGFLPWHNAVSLKDKYKVKGWGGVDFYPAIKGFAFPASPSRAAPYGNGNGEWYELIMHHKTVAERGEFTLYWRQYTVGGQVSPQPWKIDARYMTGQAGQAFRGVTTYTMGVNRNRQYDEPMFIYWGPFEIVDGSQYPNPWNLPGG